MQWRAVVGLAEASRVPSANDITDKLMGRHTCSQSCKRSTVVPWRVAFSKMVGKQVGTDRYVESSPPKQFHAGARRKSQ